jgi:hypothetical protein
MFATPTCAARTAQFAVRSGRSCHGLLRLLEGRKPGNEGRKGAGIIALGLRRLQHRFQQRDQSLEAQLVFRQHQIRAHRVDDP